MNETADVEQKTISTVPFPRLCDSGQRNAAVINDSNNTSGLGERSGMCEKNMSFSGLAIALSTAT